jgi:hypothetical protein
VNSIRKGWRAQKNEVDYILISYIKTNSKCLLCLNVRSKTTKLLEENMDINFYDLGLANAKSTIDTHICTHTHTHTHTHKDRFDSIKNFCV